MPRLVKVPCPNCRAPLQVDPERELVMCSRCNTESFVKTATRPLPPQMAYRYRFVVDATPRRTGCVLMTMLFAVGAALLAWFGAQQFVGPLAKLVETTLTSASRTESPVATTLTSASRTESPVATSGRGAVGENTRGTTGIDANAAHHDVRETSSVETPSEIPLSDVESSKLGSVRLEAPSETEGHLPREVIQRIVRQSYAPIRACYKRGLKRNPAMEGTVKVRFVIGTDGSVTRAEQAENDGLIDPVTVQCILALFRSRQFPAPQGGPVSVLYPLKFAANR